MFGEKDDLLKNSLMKKIIILLIGALSIMALAYIAINLSKSEKVSGDLSLIDFAIEDTASVDKIEIYRRIFHSCTFTRRNLVG